MELEEIIRPHEADRCLTFVDGRGAPESVSYADLTQRAGAAGAALVRAGVAPGDAVAILIGNDLASVTATLGIWMAGATVVSVPPPRPRASALYRAGFAPALAALGCRTVVGSPRLAALLGDDVGVVGHAELAAAGTGPEPDRPVAGPALVQFTSGSVGTPKGVVIGPGVLGSHVAAFGRAMGADGAHDRGVSWLPLYHDMGLVGSFLGALAFRIPLTVLSPAAIVLNPRGWMDACASTRATITAGSDFAFRLAARAVREPHGDLSALRWCFSGGEQVSWATLERFAAATEASKLRWESLAPVYGLAEATAAVTLPPPERGPIQGPGGAVSAGPPLLGVSLRTEPTLGIRGPWLLDGYVTPAGAVPATGPDGWFDTADLATVHEGELYLRGRADEVVSAGGHNHFAEDVEAVALSANDAAVVGVSAFRSPDDLDRFALAVEMAGLDGVDARSLGRSLQGAVSASLGIRVSPVLVLQPWTIPRTSSGKVKRAECRSLLQDDGWPARKVLALVR